MYGDQDLPNGYSGGGESSQSKISKQICEQNFESPNEKIRISENGRDELPSKPSKIGSSGAEQLTLSSKPGSPEKEAPGNNLLSSFEKATYKGKEVVSEAHNQEDRWVERDFLNLNEARGGSSKREMDQEIEKENLEKKPRLETLNLSLALPTISLSLNGDAPPVPIANRSIQSLVLAASHNNSLTTCSNDFTAASLSYSYSHPFSHNPSCSLTRYSTENHEHSVGSTHRRDCDQIWHCGEGTNGSVHSRFRPTGDGGVGYALMQGGRSLNRDSCNNSLHVTSSSENVSFYPSELPARPVLDTESGDSRGRDFDSEHMKDFVKFDGRRIRNPSRPERILRETVSESVDVMAHKIQNFPEETFELTREYLMNLIAVPERREELARLQSRLDRRSDLTMETLSKAHTDQLDMLVAIKTGLPNFLSRKNRLPTMELMEIFLFLRCRNVNCKSSLPVDDCDCKICSANKGFCRECMCPVCSSFDCANNTCSWVGCDVCSHWCHADCGIQKNLIKPGPSLKGLSGMSEMQFHCIGCGHASEMFGFVKDVFLYCAKDWGVDVLIKELNFVRKIFMGSEDFKGKELRDKAEQMVTKLERKMMSPLHACDSLTHFFKVMDGLSDNPPSITSPKDSAASQASLRKLSATAPSASLPPLYAAYNTSLAMEDEFLLGTPKKDGFETLESVVRIKELEARMYQSRADEARKEAESYRQMVHARSERMEEEHGEKLAKLCLQETEERRRKKVEELKVLENSRCDYYNMKMRMQAEIAGLLERIEATRKLLV